MSRRQPVPQSARQPAHRPARQAARRMSPPKTSLRGTRLILFVSVLATALLAFGLLAGRSALAETPAPGSSIQATLAAPAVVATPLPATINVAEAAALQSAGAWILDVRQPEEWNAGHIDGAQLIPLGELSSRLSEVPQDVPIVVVCRSGNRSASGRDILLNAGYPSVTSMAGGIKDWAAAGYPVTTSP